MSRSLGDNGQFFNLNTLLLVAAMAGVIAEPGKLKNISNNSKKFYNIN